MVFGRVGQSSEDDAQKSAEPGEDAPEVVSGGREDGIGGVAGPALEVVASEVTLLPHVEGISKSQACPERSRRVSRLCGEIDERVQIFLTGRAWGPIPISASCSATPPYQAGEQDVGAVHRVVSLTA